MAAITAMPPEPTELLIAPGRRGCSAINLPMGGILSMPNGDIVTLTAAGAFKPLCTPINPPAIIANGGGGSISIDDTADGAAPTEDGPQYSDFRIPFYASTYPQFYALAATTVVAYTLVIMLFITPRSFLDGGVVVLGRKGFTNGGTGTSIGGRPWLQKVAALSVAISLTIATEATFRTAEYQYSFGITNAEDLRNTVLGGLELKIIRIISNTFLWLAQAQTLIRLFPRQREKVIIKWTAFALITLDVIFQSLNSFQYVGTTPSQSQTRPRSFTDAVPALSYLFALALGVLYAAWVIYYALMKKRYAFYHPQMKNMCLVAGLSILSILVPVVFFILDISKPEFTGWGDYVRWVGAAAASVIVWEWVERIEALEREEKKDGILGREVFDGDEMLDFAAEERSRARRKKKSLDEKDWGSNSSGRSGRDHSPTTGRGNMWPAVAAIRSRYRSRSAPRRAAETGQPANTESTNNDRIRFLQPPLWPARPPPAASPISRTDTASAASTIYAVRYHALTETTSRTTPPPASDVRAVSRRASTASSHHSDGASTSSNQGPPAQTDPVVQPTETRSGSRWRALAQGLPFRRVHRTDEERPAVEEERPAQTQPQALEEGSRWDIRTRLEEFAMAQAEKLRERIRPTPDTESLPVTVIPAPPRRGAALAQLMEEELESQDGPSRTTLDRRNSSASRTVGQGDEWLPASPTSAVPPPAVAPRTGSRRSTLSPPGTGSRDTASVSPTPPQRNSNPGAQEGSASTGRA
ncbi:PalH/RIM21-domain-containing protein [Echria macrotheca]|uniref:PalH/RIM21-domain-containing protein n=1 Tax=Echria macrotheca TaxID=438768 RepID=A0AAJ0F8A1_9PEZI|nr:PalH/RIM21-domain-containing protein [Echria macrotheca]